MSAPAAVSLFPPNNEGDELPSGFPPAAPPKRAEEGAAEVVVGFAPKRDGLGWAPPPAWLFCPPNSEPLWAPPDAWGFWPPNSGLDAWLLPPDWLF